MDDKIRPLNKIRTEDEYNEYKKYLDRYVVEYKWFQQSETPYKSVMSKSRQYEEGSDARVALENRGRLIKDNEYATFLEHNITAYMLFVEEYEAKQENRSILDILKGIINKNEEIESYLKRRYMRARAESKDPHILEPINLSLQSPEDCIRQVNEEIGGVIGIEPIETALVPIDSKTQQIFAEIRNMLDECLLENGIDVKKGKVLYVNKEDQVIEQNQAPEKVIEKTVEQTKENEDEKHVEKQINKGAVLENPDSGRDAIC